MSEAKQAESKTYTGGCQCGAVRYEVTMALGPVIACNCSMCGRAGTLLAFVPADNFQLQSGDDVVTDYTFNKHAIHHLFCSKCGIKSFALGNNPDGSSMVAINARCLDGVELEDLEIRQFDGRSR
jgi:hypothetical protein